MDYYPPSGGAAAVGTVVMKTPIDASTNPNYPSASKGDCYPISVAGKIGGASGKSVDVGDIAYACADNAGGTEASVGTSWIVGEHNLVGALVSGGALGTPSSGNLSACTELPPGGVTFTATAKILARKTASGGVGEEASASEVLDFLGNTRGSILYRGASGWVVLTPGTSGDNLQSGGAGADPAWAAASGGAMDYIMVSDQKTQNTHGGTFTAGAWRTRDINTENSDTGGHCSISSNQITLAAGTYVCYISAPAYSTTVHQLRLQNISDSSTIIPGQNTYNLGSVQTSAVLIGKFTLAASKILEIQHYGLATSATYGFGSACNFTTEVYTIAQFWKE